MFKKIDRTSNVETVVGVSTSFTGNINSSGSIKVEGEYTGDIITKGDIILGSVANVKGNLNAVNVKIDGRVEGNIVCSGLLSVGATGKISGNVETTNLSVEDGGVINGMCSMTLDDIKRIIQPEPDQNIEVKNVNE